jgi:hypothetical protein
MSELVFNGQRLVLPLTVVKRKGYYAKLGVNETYIGRPSRWGNPFKIGPDGDRQQVCIKYYHYVKSNPLLMMQIDTLRGKSLACFCAPELCHGHILGLILYEKLTTPRLLTQ